MCPVKDKDLRERNVSLGYRDCSRKMDKDPCESPAYSAMSSTFEKLISQRAFYLPSYNSLEPSFNSLLKITTARGESVFCIYDKLPTIIKSRHRQLPHQKLTGAIILNYDKAIHHPENIACTHYSVSLGEILSIVSAICYETTVDSGWYPVSRPKRREK